MIAASKSRLGAVALCLFATVLSGCQDSSSDPLAVILTEETRSVLAADALLPSLPVLAEEAGATGSLARAVESWNRSWDLAPEEGRAQRSRVSTESAETLARSIGQPRVSEAVRSVGETLGAAASLGTSQLTDGIAQNLAQAKVEHARAQTALSAGRMGEALGAALLAADLIREVGPESVSLLLVSRAEARLEILAGAEKKEPAMAAVAEQIFGDGDAPEAEEDPVQVDLDRARRLIRGARLAIDEGDFVRAIQRAFYACQVLGVNAG